MTATIARPQETLFRANGRRRTKNNVATVLVTLSVLIALIPLIWVLWTVISSGLSTVLHASWWTQTQENITYTDPGGGMLHALIGTLEQVGLCTAVAVPLGILVGIYLVEYGRNNVFSRVTTFMVDIMTGIPSIVAALFIFALLNQVFGFGKAGWLVSAALLVLMIPVIVRSTEEILRLVPNELREASYALGIPKWKTILKVVVPTAFSGLITGVILGIARVAGETAPLLILVSTTDSINANPFSQNQTALPLLIRKFYNDAGQTLTGGSYHLDKNGNPVQGALTNYAVDRMWGAALTLILIVLVLNVIARLIGRTNKLAK